MIRLILSLILCTGFPQVGVILNKPNFLTAEQVTTCQNAEDQVACFSELPGMLGVEKEIGKKNVYYLRLHPRVPVARYQDGFVDQAGIYFKVPQDLNGQELPVFAVPLSEVINCKRLYDELARSDLLIQKITLDGAGQWEVLLETGQLIKLGSQPLLHAQRVLDFFAKFAAYKKTPSQYFDFRNNRQVAIGRLN